MRGLCRGGGHEQRFFGAELHVIFADAAAGAATCDAVNVDSDFARQTTYMRRGGHGITMLSAGDFAQLLRHSEGRRLGLRWIGRQRLFFGLALSAQSHVEGESSAVLLGEMFDRL